MKKWQEYYNHVGEKPNSLVVRALDNYVCERSLALDLGAGNLRDSKYLLSQGFKRVIAVDSSDEALAFQVPGIELHISPIQSFVPEHNTLNLALSCNTLFFLSTRDIKTVITNVQNGLHLNGIFVCNVLGEEDGWIAENKPVSWFTPESFKGLFDDMEILWVNESKHLGAACRNGTRQSKFWHQLSIAVRKL
jgi:hypothetical protein